jgi:hypothetical protein
MKANKYVDQVLFCLSDYLQLGYREYSLGSLLPHIAKVEGPAQSSGWNLKVRKRLSALTYWNAGLWKPVRKGVTQCLKDLHTNEGSLCRSANKGYEAPLLLLNDYLNSIGSFNCRSIHIGGYWQNITPFVDRVAELGVEVEPTLTLVPPELNCQPYVAIHLRRGDYHNELYNRHFYCKLVSPLSFILNAMSVVPSELRSAPIVIVSDDLNAAQQLQRLLLDKGADARLVKGLGILSDWSIIRYASYRILANSTFSMSAALLGPISGGLAVHNVMPQWINHDTHASDWGWDLLAKTVLL